MSYFLRLQALCFYEICGPANVCVSASLCISQTFPLPLFLLSVCFVPFQFVYLCFTLFFYFIIVVYICLFSHTSREREFRKRNHNQNCTSHKSLPNSDREQFQNMTSKSHKHCNLQRLTLKSYTWCHILTGGSVLPLAVTDSGYNYLSL